MAELRYYEAERIPYWRWRWWIGLPRPFWIANQAHIGRFVEQHKLQPIDPRDLVWDDPVPVVRTEQPLEESDAVQIRWPRPFPGGLRFAHVHHFGELYALDDEQWKDFSGQIMDTVRERINNAGQVGLFDLVELSDAADVLG